MLKIEHLSKNIVQNVNLTVAPGQIVGLLGPNGAGKTTCFSMVCGLLFPEQGSITLEGIDITYSPLHIRARQGLRYLPQESSVFRKLTVEENILAVLELSPALPKLERQQRCEALLEEFQLTHIRDTLGIKLSGGERRRTEIARAVAKQCKYLLLDEPFAGVDPIAIQDIIQCLRYLVKKHNMGILMTDHQVRETLSLCHHAYILHQGRVLASGDQQTLIQNPTVREVYLGTEFDYTKD